MDIYTKHINLPEKKWRIVYTRSKWEKKADELLKRSGIVSYCPVVKTVKKWADRKKTIEVPLFTSYIFVHVNHQEQERVLQTDGIVGYVRDFGQTAEISLKDMASVRDLVNNYEDIECINIKSYKKGDHVIVNDDILFDLGGEVIEVRGKKVLLLMKGLDCGLIAKVKVERNVVTLKD